MRCRLFPSISAGVVLLLQADRAPAVTWGADYFPNVPLTTQNGDTVHFYDDLLKGKRVVINFIYTRCGDSCPLETARLAQVAKILGNRMGRDIFFYSISVDPERDTPAELKAYARSYGAGPGWLFLTGKQADVGLIRQRLGAAPRRGENDVTGHSTSFTIGNEATRQWTRDSSLDHPQYIAAIIRDWFAYEGHGPAKSYAEAPRLPDSVSDKGAYLFQSVCEPCHTIGRGDSVGPDLRGITRTRDLAWLARFIEAPDRVLDDHDPVATALFNRYRPVRMPNLRLKPMDVEALLGYLEKQEKQRQ